MPEPTELPDMEKDLDFATLAIAHRVVSREQLEKATHVLEKEAEDGRQPRSVEDVLLEQGILKSEQVWAVYKAKERLLRDARTRGQRIGGYEIISKLGEGGLGVVYKARQLSMGRIVALKVLHERWVTDDEFRKRFLVEARLVGRLSHPNLIQVIDVGRYRNTLYFSMEFVDGEPVDTTLEHNGRMDIQVCISIAIQVTGALEYLQMRRIVHRDIKPGNIMITKGGIAKLGDFGFVKSSLESVLSTEGEVLGTPDYISPEAARGETNLDYRSDLYSLGATLYHMLSGCPPFGGSVSDVMDQHIKSDPRPLEKIVSDIPDGMVAIVNRLMHKKPENRYVLFSELIADLESLRAATKTSLPITQAASLNETISRASNSDLDQRVREIELLRKINRLEKFLVIGGVALALALLGLAYLAFFRQPLPV
ncbi:MAG: serine/threonine protein kinase [Planctomycetota bacterium]|jgi:serine/threonine-protein kinase|nr:serine/threonine protein kinase [Planctomycetota bacterium]